jgi:CBS domain-containing protein
VEKLLHDYVLRYRCSTFPLTDDDGTVLGLATLSRMKNVAPARRTSTPARVVAWPRALVTAARPDDPLLDVVRRASGIADGRVLVFDDGVLVGIVSPTDIARTLQLAHAANGAGATTGGPRPGNAHPPVPAG